ncbi:MAG: DUF547 domain-containing protein [Myxococcota bacterium]|nr:DUF547 domain-containing protein [Myxococcota bacterium]
MSRVANSTRAWNALIALLSLSLLVSCVATPRKLTVTERLPSTKIDQRGWNELLGKNVQEGFVNYQGFCGSEAFRSYLEQLGEADLAGATRDEILSFYTNAYNASAIESILAGNRPSSLLGRYHFFLRNRHAVAGENITLWDLEHERLQPLDESRIHFAIICASRSCPALQSQPFRAETLDAQLDAAAREFINDSERNRFYPAERVALISAIFDWHKEDFTSETVSLSDYLALYVDDPDVADILRKGDFELRFLPYDWNLNGMPPSSKGGCLDQERE